MSLDDTLYSRDTYCMTYPEMHSSGYLYHIVAGQYEWHRLPFIVRAFLSNRTQVANSEWLIVPAPHVMSTPIARLCPRPNSFLFADDCLIYRTIHPHEDHEILQDLNTLTENGQIDGK